MVWLPFLLNIAHRSCISSLHCWSFYDLMTKDYKRLWRPLVFIWSFQPCRNEIQTRVTLPCHLKILWGSYNYQRFYPNQPDELEVAKCQIFIGSHVFFELKIQIKSEALSNHYSSHLKLMFHTSVFLHIIPIKCQNLLYLHAKEVKLLCIPETLCDQISRKPPMHLSPVNFAFWVLFTVIKWVRNSLFHQVLV